MKRFLTLIPLFFASLGWAADGKTTGDIGLLQPTTGVIDASRSWADKYNKNFQMIADTLTAINAKSPVLGVQDEGTPQGNATVLNFVGSAISIACLGSTCTATVTATGGGGGGTAGVWVATSAYRFNHSFSTIVFLGSFIDSGTFTGAITTITVNGNVFWNYSSTADAQQTKFVNFRSSQDASFTELIISTNAWKAFASTASVVDLLFSNSLSTAGVRFKELETSTNAWKAFASTASSTDQALISTVTALGLSTQTIRSDLTIFNNFKSTGDARSVILGNSTSALSVPIIFQDEAGDLSTGTVVNFAGAGVTASRVGSTITVTIPGSAGGAGASSALYIQPTEISIASAFFPPSDIRVFNAGGLSIATFTVKNTSGGWSAAQTFFSSATFTTTVVISSALITMSSASFAGPVVSTSGFSGANSTFSYFISNPGGVISNAPSIEFGNVGSQTGIGGAAASLMLYAGGANHSMSSSLFTFATPVAQSIVGSGPTSPIWKLAQLGGGPGLYTHFLISSLLNWGLSDGLKDVMRIEANTRKIAFGGIGTIGGSFHISTASITNEPILIVSSGTRFLEITGASATFTVPIISTTIFASSGVFDQSLSVLGSSISDASVMNIIGSTVNTGNLLYIQGPQEGNTGVQGAAIRVYSNLAGGYISDEHAVINATDGTGGVGRNLVIVNNPPSVGLAHAVAGDNLSISDGIGLGNTITGRSQTLSITGNTSAEKDVYGDKVTIINSNSSTNQGTRRTWGGYYDVGASNSNGDTQHIAIYGRTGTSKKGYGLYLLNENSNGIAYGVYVDTGTGAGRKVSAVFNNYVGLGIDTPTAMLDIVNGSVTIHGQNTALILEAGSMSVRGANSGVSIGDLSLTGFTSTVAALGLLFTNHMSSIDAKATELQTSTNAWKIVISSYGAKDLAHDTNFSTSSAKDRDHDLYFSTFAATDLALRNSTPTLNQIITFQDEATDLTSATVVNFAGAGVTASRVGSTVTVTISGGAAGTTDVDWGYISTRPVNMNSFPIDNVSSITIINTTLPFGSTVFQVLNDTFVITNDGRFGIGTSSPNFNFELSKDNIVSGPNMVITGYGTNVSPNFVARTARGSYGAPSATQANDTLFQFGGRGYGTTKFGVVNVARLRMAADDAFTDASQPTNISFETSPSGSFIPVERMRITSTGKLGIGTQNAVTLLEVNNGSITIRGNSAGVIIETTSYSDSSIVFSVLKGTLGVQANGGIFIGSGPASSLLDVTGGSLTVRGAGSGIQLGAVSWAVQMSSSDAQQTKFANFEATTNVRLDQLNNSTNSLSSVLVAKDEGNLLSSMTAINFVGPGVVATNTQSTITVTINPQGDNFGSHRATKAVDMANFAVINATGLRIGTTDYGIFSISTDGVTNTSILSITTGTNASSRIFDIWSTSFTINIPTVTINGTLIIPNTTGQMMVNQGAQFNTNGGGTNQEDVSMQAGLGPQTYVFYAKASSATLSVGTNTQRATLLVYNDNSQKYSLMVTTGAGILPSLTQPTSSYAIAVSSTQHFSVGGGSPTVSSCGTSPNGFPINATDQAGTIAVGGTVPTACTLTFQTPFKLPPVCVVSDNSTTVNASVTAISNSAATFGFSASLGGGLVYYNCLGVRE